MSVTEISKYMLNLIIKPHAVIDKAICNNNAKDGMIHDIADYLTQQFKHIKGVHSVSCLHIFGKQHNTILIMRCSGIFSPTQRNQVIVFIILFKLSQPLFTTTLGCRVIITSSAAIVLMMRIIFSTSMFILSALLSTQINFNWPSSFLGGNLADVRVL